MMIPEDYINKVYAGWLAKIIGIRLGAPVESWSYQKIRNIFGDYVDHYMVDYNDFAADDDSNGPIFLIRALADKKPGKELTAQDVADALLNYAPYEHGFFWWGSYGISTEHTAYLNLRNGIPAPRSGSIEQNGKTVAEQIGGQIFIDTWGLVSPGNPDQAARFAAEAASVTHGGNGVYGGIFIAVAISLAFIENNVRTIIEKALKYIPEDCEYARVVRAVMRFYDEHPRSTWREAFQYVHDHFGYDRYPGNCHIIPNCAVMILALLYGNGNFDDTICICNMCGWDTDCNVGNIATIMGVLVGLEGINYEKWSKPVHDMLTGSSVVGSLNIMDIPYGASYIANLAYQLAGQEPPQPWRNIFAERIESCHFEYPTSTHNMRVRGDAAFFTGGKLETVLMNTDESAFTGNRSLRMYVKPTEPGNKVYLYKKTYYYPKDFSNSRYDPAFSPILYPGQKVIGAVMIPEYSRPAYVRMYVHEQRSGKEITGERIYLEKNSWRELSLSIPYIEGGLLDEAGFLFEMSGDHSERTCEFTALIDDLRFEGEPDYMIDFRNEVLEDWNKQHKEISQFTRMKGSLYLEDGQLHLSSYSDGEAYTGSHNWRDYKAVFAVTPVIGETHAVNVRVQGSIRSYALALDDQKLRLLKNVNGYKVVLAEAPCHWEHGKEYILSVTVKDCRIDARMGDIIISAEDHDNPYLYGSVGMTVLNGSHMKCRYISVKG